MLTCDTDDVIADLKTNVLWTQKGPLLFRYGALRRVTKLAELDRNEARRTDAALSKWQAAKPAWRPWVKRT